MTGTCPKPLHWMGLLLVGASLAGIAHAHGHEGEAGAGKKGTWEQGHRGHSDRLKEFREAIHRIEQAIQQGKGGNVEHLAQKVLAKWNSLSPEAKQAFRQNHSQAWAKLREAKGHNVSGHPGPAKASGRSGHASHGQAMEHIMPVSRPAPGGKSAHGDKK